jgi:hypothetical protein
MADDSSPPVPRDPRAVMVALGAMLGIVGVAVLVVLEGSDNAVAVGSAAFTAIATIVGAYFGVKVANLAREENAKEGEKAQLRIAALAGALPQDAAGRALKEAEEFIDRRLDK